MPNSSLVLQCLLGIQCKDFAMIAADQINTQSIIVMKNDEEKLHEISNNLILGVIGNSGDAMQFAQFIEKNILLYHMKNGYELNTAAAVHFTRKNLAEAIKFGTPSMVNLIICGYDNVEGGQLYSLDFLGSCVKVPFGVHGFGGLLSMSILDRYYRPDLSEPEAYEIMRMCVREVHQRLFVSLPNFQVKAISKKGISSLPIICPASLLASK